LLFFFLACSVFVALPSLARSLVRSLARSVALAISLSAINNSSLQRITEQSMAAVTSVAASLSLNSKVTNFTH
jgi:hypothetical protein